MANLLDTDRVSASYRARCVRISERKLLISNFNGTTQAEDLTKPPNCNGFGRVRHFRREADPSWVPNPLPIDPASKALRLAAPELLHAQVFQNAACNWRCWYCFVPFNMLDASEERASWLTADDLVDLYIAEQDRPPMIDLTGGQPELVPEWVVWTMRSLKDRGLEGKVYLWSDDNLSVDYFWTKLSDEERDVVTSFRGYGRVGCFKGFDEASFSFNTKAAPELFERQFALMRRYAQTSIDLYAYTTFTTMAARGIDDAMKRFVDRLQEIDPNLPLRTVPLKVGAFGVVKRRLSQNDHRYAALEHQKVAIEAWRLELESRFTVEQRSMSIADVGIGRRTDCGH
jgi:uncharacterized Fe-S cluster-containing radical SAM superfamily protein